MKLFVAEAGSQTLIRLVEAAEDREKTISALASVEVRSAIRRRERAGEIPPAHATSALATLEAESLRLVEHPVSPSVLIRAAAVIDRHALRALDSIQLATALITRESLMPGDNLVFICSDGRLLEAATAESLPVIDPASSNSDR